MPALRDLQASFAAHLAGEARADLAAVVAGDSISAEARLRVYRHHMLQSLAAALGATYSTVQALVGETFFCTMAEAFVVRDLPRQPVLAEYGEGFATFIEAYAPASELPYLADMARLDWALNAAFHKPEQPRLGAEDLATAAPDRLLCLRLTLAPGTAVVSSPYPIDRIWHLSQPGAAEEETLDLEGGGATLLVLRRADDAAFVSLDPAEAAFVAAVAASDTLERAAQSAFDVDPAFDLSTTFGRLLALQAFAALQQ